MRFAFLLWTAPLAAMGGFSMARVCRPERPPSESSQATYGPHRSGLIHAVPQGSHGLSKTGSQALPEIFAALGQASAADLRHMAKALLNDPHRRRDLGVWGPLLARWAELDGAGLIAFVQKDVAPGERPWLQSKAWYAWGAASPQAASEAGRELSVELASALIAGMAQRDVRGAVAFAMQIPNAQLNLGEIVEQIAQAAPELIDDLLPKAVYDRMREPLQRAQWEALAETDPAAAIALARKSGRLMDDPVPVAMHTIAEHDPVKAAAVFEQMPSSRSRALAAVTLAKTWAAQDAPAATEWVRRSLTGPVQQCALLEIAAASGGSDPLDSLRLVEEAGWTQDSNFHRIADGGSHVPSEVFHRPTPVRTAGLLLRQLSLLNPPAAQEFLRHQVPESLRAAVGRNAGMAPTP